MLAFLTYLESDRKNSAATRNCRLVAIHRLFAYAAGRDPRHAQLCRRVLDIPLKKTTSNSMTYLNQDEVKALLAAPSARHRLGLRDRALLTLLAAVLPGQPPDQLTDLRTDRRASGGVRVGPFLVDQAPVPGEQSARRHDPLYPKVPGQQPRQGGYHRPVSPVRFRAGDLAAQDRDLVLEHQDFHAWKTSLRARSASQPNNRTMSRQTRRKSTSAEDRSPGQMLCTSSGTPQDFRSGNSAPSC